LTQTTQDGNSASYADVWYNASNQVERARVFDREVALEISEQILDEEDKARIVAEVNKRLNPDNPNPPDDFIDWYGGAVPITADIGIVAPGRPTLGSSVPIPGPTGTVFMGISAATGSGNIPVVQSSNNNFNDDDGNKSWFKRIWDDLFGIKPDPNYVIPPDVKLLSEQNIKNSGKTVLGRYPGYKDKAQSMNASFFDIGKVAWENLKTNAKQWAVNRHFLDLIAGKGDQVYLSEPIKNISPDSWTAREIKYLITQKGYRLVNQWSLKKKE